MDSTSKNAVTKTVQVEGTPFAYREAGPATGIPVVFLHHFTAVLDDWDPAVVDGIAAERRVILVDLRGVGGSGGTTPDSVEAMAGDAIAFLEALGLSTVDLLGFSLGGMVAQLIVQQRPDLVRRVILAGTAPAGDPGPAATGAILQAALEKAGAPERGRLGFGCLAPRSSTSAMAIAAVAVIQYSPRPCSAARSVAVRAYRPAASRSSARVRMIARQPITHTLARLLIGGSMTPATLSRTAMASSSRPCQHRFAPKVARHLGVPRALELHRPAAGCPTRVQWSSPGEAWSRERVTLQFIGVDAGMP